MFLNKNEDGDMRRGFSFMPENKLEVDELQYVEGGELSRAWKIKQRERFKDLESKIWDEFVKEQDVVSSICSDDPYTFLERLPEDCLKELMELQLKSMQAEKIEEVNREEKQEQKQQVFVNEMREPRETMVSFAEDDDNDCDVINIFDDDKDDDVSGCEAEVIVDSESVCTVRENQNPESITGNDSPESPCKEKSAENVTNLIETSIYRAKVKELQSKVNLELLSVITTLEAQDLNKIEPHDLPKLQRQCSEFCARYNRIYLYQLKRQIQDMMRHNNAALPFARHTFLRSQMTRAVSFHQNLLQALQVVHKWFTQKAPLHECAETLKSFSLLVHEGDHVCPYEVHNEELLQTCQNLNNVLDIYLVKVNNFLSSDNVTSPRGRKAKTKQLGKKRSFGHGSKTGLKQNLEADARLSMYSLDPHRANSKHSSCKDMQSGGTSRVRLNDAAVAAGNKPDEATDVAQKKKTPRSRRPLMRAPGGGRRRREKPREPDNITTMVETVKMCASSHISREHSPRRSSQDSPYPSPRDMMSFPRGIHKAKSTISQRQTPRMGARQPMPPPVLNVISQEDLKLDLQQTSKVLSESVMSPVIKVQCEKKYSSRRSPTADSQSRPDATGSVASLRNSSSHELTDKEKKGRKKISEIKDIGESCEVSRLLRRLCGGSSPIRNVERVTGTRNTQLLCLNGSSPRQPSTPQLLRILEETIQKKAPKPQFCPKPKVKDVERFRMPFNLTAETVDTLFQYRTKFVQHMLSSAMYANSAVGKPWEMIGSVSEQIIDNILLSLAKEMQLEDYIKELFISETQ